MTTWQKLQEIERKKCVYNIHYCRAGIGFIFYYPEKDPMKFEDVKIGDSTIQKNVGWEEALSVEKYYPTFVQAVNAEYKNL